jgi:hypothetical protein
MNCAALRFTATLKPAYERGQAVAMFLTESDSKDVLNGKRS